VAVKAEIGLAIAAWIVANPQRFASPRLGGLGLAGAFVGRLTDG
jgi:hypothetical protein